MSIDKMCATIRCFLSKQKADYTGGVHAVVGFLNILGGAFACSSKYYISFDVVLSIQRNRFGGDNKAVSLWVIYI